MNLEYLNYAVKRVFENRILLPLYRRSIPSKVRKMRSKEQIKVLFVLSEVAAWKTENLYNAMQVHPRFLPYLGLTASTENYLEFSKLLEYVKSKGYAYTNMDDWSQQDIWAVQPEIVFYQKPYLGEYKYQNTFINHLNSLFCYVPYAQHALLEDWSVEQPLQINCWMEFFENYSVAQEFGKLMSSKGSNAKVSGYPIFDYFLFDDPNIKTAWKENGSKKKIIWAPHHTIADMHNDGIAYSTFLDYADFMKELAERNRDTIQWAFKPHPVLKVKLKRIWGEDRVEAYYKWWATQDYTQLETGEYIGLFKQSDALIHDCSSFTVEYQLVNKPAMYLERGYSHDDNLSTFVKRAHEIHYHGYNKEDIIEFVGNVIKGYDVKADERNDYIHKFLLPPNGKTACENIIDLILGDSK